MIFCEEKNHDIALYDLGEDWINMMLDDNFSLQ